MSQTGDDVASEARTRELGRKKDHDTTSPPKARLSEGDGSGSRELRVTERTVRQNVTTMQLPILTRSNYTEWALVMRVQLQANGWWEAIKPGFCDYRVDREALGVILRAVPPELLRSLATKDSAKEAWDALEVLRMGSERVREARAQTRRREFENLTFKDGEKVEEFAIHLTRIVSDLEVFGDGVTEHKAVLKFLRCVPPRFRQLAHFIESLLDLKTMSIEELTGRFLAVEESLDMDDEGDKDGGSRLLLTEEEWKEKMKKKNSNPRDKKKVRCFNCQELGHFAWECPEKKKKDVSGETEEKEEKALLGDASDEPTLL